MIRIFIVATAIFPVDLQSTITRSISGSFREKFTRLSSVMPTIPPLHVRISNKHLQQQDLGDDIRALIAAFVPQLDNVECRPDPIWQILGDFNSDDLCPAILPVLARFALPRGQQVRSLSQSRPSYLKKRHN